MARGAVSRSRGDHGIAGASPERSLQHSGGVIRCDQLVGCIRIREHAARHNDVSSRRLRGGDRFSLSGRSVVDVSGEAYQGNVAARAYGDFASDALVSADVVHPLDVAVAIILDQKSVIGIFTIGLSWTKAG